MMDRYVVTTSSTYEKKTHFVTIFAYFDNFMNLESFCNFGFPIFIYDSYTCSSILAFSFLSADHLMQNEYLYVEVTSLKIAKKLFKLIILTIVFNS